MGRVDIDVQVGFQRMIRRHLVVLAAFLVQPDPAALALRVEIFDAHLRHRTDTGEGEAITLINAQSRRPTTVETSILSSRARAASGVNTGQGFAKCYCNPS